MGQSLDNDLLQAKHVPMNIGTELLEVQQRVYHQLTRSMVSDIATSVDVVVRRIYGFKPIIIQQKIFGFSAFTWLMGTVSSVFGLKLVRLGLGLSEGPCPVGLASTINNWFPPKEKATATGAYIAATMFAPIIVPPLAVWIAVTWGCIGFDVGTDALQGRVS